MTVCETSKPIRQGQWSLIGGKKMRWVLQLPQSTVLAAFPGHSTETGNHARTWQIPWDGWGLRAESLERPKRSRRIRLCTSLPPSHCSCTGQPHKTGQKLSHSFKGIQPLQLSIDAALLWKQAPWVEKVLSTRTLHYLLTFLRMLLLLLKKNLIANRSTFFLRVWVTS